jgi:hypothetical protein
MRLVLAPIGPLVAVLLFACAGVPDDSRIGVVAPPRDEASFRPVGEMLGERCGSLDCHGSTQRNLIVFGCRGLRLDAADLPGCRDAGGKDTTAAELDATYRSLVGLEPVVMSAVVSGKGKHPELLTFMRKARGDEAHKGGMVFAPGAREDACLVAWLAGTTDAALCATADGGAP